MNIHQDGVPQYQSRATPPALARAIAEWFPELGGRSIAVSEAKITRDNVPTLPLCMVSLMREVGNDSVRTQRTEPEEQLVAEFWFEPAKYSNGETNAETPFWAFYDYDLLRDRLVTHLRHWLSPHGSRVEYFALEVDSDQFATVITFQLRHQFVFCELDPYEDPCSPEFLYGDGHLITPATFDLNLIEPCEPCIDAPTQVETISVTFSSCVPSPPDEH